jgi:hypothetical protein
MRCMDVTNPIAVLAEHDAFVVVARKLESLDIAALLVPALLDSDLSTSPI